MTIKELRIKSELTQQEFSQLLQIPKRTIEDWETGKRVCKDYISNLIEYKLTNDGIIPKQNSEEDGSVINGIEK